MYTRYTCIYTICTPLNTSKHPIYALIHHYMIGTLHAQSPLRGGVRRRLRRPPSPLRHRDATVWGGECVVPAHGAAARARADTGTCWAHHIIPFIHPLYTFIAVFTPMYTRYTCIYTTHTPLNTSKHPIYTLYTPYPHHCRCLTTSSNSGRW